MRHLLTELTLISARLSAALAGTTTPSGDDTGAHWRLDDVPV